MPQAWPSPCGSFVASTDRTLIAIDDVHAFLTTAYWSKGIPKDIVEKSLRGSVCIGIYHKVEEVGKGIPAEEVYQVGFARWVTDCATFGYLADLHIHPRYQGRGLGKWLIQCAMLIDEVQGLRNYMLLTTDACELYERLAGFSKVDQGNKSWVMQKITPSRILYTAHVAENEG